MEVGQVTRVKMDIPYFQTPNNIFDVENLTPQELLVYIYLCRCGNHGGQAFPSYQTIANKCKISRSTALRAVKSLYDKHLLSKRKRPKSNRDNDTNIYYVLPPSVREELPSVSQTPPPSVTGTPPSVSVTPRKRTTEKELDIYKEPQIKGDDENSSSFLLPFLNIRKRAYLFNVRKEPEITEADIQHMQTVVEQGTTEIEFHGIVRDYFRKKRHRYSIEGLLKDTA
jgi:DNA-binding MarR family transcriptional regulator